MLALRNGEMYDLREGTETLFKRSLWWEICHVGCPSNISELSVEAPAFLETCRHREIFLQIYVNTQSWSENYPSMYFIRICVNDTLPSIADIGIERVP